jgi:pimeloyl-ACP methyl ester carboxylesterase
MVASRSKKHIEQLYISGMRGRIMRMPAPKGKAKKSEILLLYGQHASLERMAGIAEFLNVYGAITVPDLPGFGGMDSFYKVGSKPTLDNYADYLAALIKLHYKNKRIRIVAVSFSFLIVTRMLQRYPDIAGRVDLLVSFVGFLHRDDFHVKPFYYWSWRTLGKTFSGKFSSSLFRYVVLQPWNIRFAYSLVSSKHPKLKKSAELEKKRQVDYEIKLWQMNDTRTRMKTLTLMLTADLCDKRVKLPVYHVSATEDFYFDNNMVEQHMKVVYSAFENIPSESETHMPTVLVDAAEAGPFVPPRLRELLSK